MPGNATRRVIIVGGGASGVLLACRLLSDPRVDLAVFLIEKRPDVGRGIAYCTANPAHLLNVRAANMSALPEDPDHFLRWLDARGAKPGEPAAPADRFSFVSRKVYGDYIASLLAPLLEDPQWPRLHIVHGECVRISETAAGIAAVLGDGRHIIGDVVVLATGHEMPAPPNGCYVDPWATPAEAGIAPELPVLIVGTGLTMVDYVLSLQLGGHRGPITAMSRRGLLPQPHRRVDAVSIDAAEVPFGAEITALLRWLRQRAEEETARGGDWRSVVDAIRPFTHRLWRGLSPGSKRRFLAHARAWWDIHRHRMAPEVERRIADAIASGALSIVAGRICAVETGAQGALVHYRRRGERVEFHPAGGADRRMHRHHQGSAAHRQSGLVEPPGAGPRAQRSSEHRPRRQSRRQRDKSIRRAVAPPVCRRSAHARGVVGGHRSAGYPQPVRGARGAPAGHAV